MELKPGQEIEVKKYWKYNKFIHFEKGDKVKVVSHTESKLSFDHHGLLLEIPDTKTYPIESAFIID